MMTSSRQIQFTVLADNIIEFERFFDIACFALGLKTSSFNFKKNLPLVLVHEAANVSFTALVGFGRWGDNYWQSEINKSLFISENPDVLVELRSAGKNKLFAIEFCSALPAGNQSWQRYARGKQLSKNQTDYFFISELGGTELGEDRKEISIRYPNPIVNYAASIENRKPGTGKFINLLVEKPGCPTNLSKDFGKLLGTKILEDYLIQNLMDDTALEKEILEHQNLIIEKYIQKKKNKSCFEQAFLISKSSSQQKISSLEWKKKFSISVTEDTQKILNLVSYYSNPYFGTDVPFTKIEHTDVKTFLNSLNQIIQGKIELQNSNLQSNIYFAAFAGFKPRGDDARPDRGLMPLVDSLSDPSDIIIALIFGPATATAEDELRANVIKVAEKNGLWGSALQSSNFVICTSQHFSKTTTIKGFRGQDKVSNLPFKILDSEFLPLPNENDVDTAVHLTCNRDAGLFPSFCNPPGGDWSGVSFYNKVSNSEIRYLTLSRAPDQNTNKRPDHIYHDIEDDNIIVVESKTSPNSLYKEKGVGEKMVHWTRYLLTHKPQVKKDSNGFWTTKTIESDKLTKVNFIKCGAFLCKNETNSYLVDLMQQCSLDYIFLYKSFGKSWEIKLLSNNSNKSIPKCFANLDLQFV